MAMKLPRMHRSPLGDAPTFHHGSVKTGGRVSPAADCLCGLNSNNECVVLADCPTGFTAWCFARPGGCDCECFENLN